MKSSYLKVLSVVALCATILPCLLYFTGVIGHSAVTLMALVGTIIWFASTPWWMGREVRVDAKEVEI
ncbi:hypothetical protein [Novipirellula artificiosorum]|uniref:Uncharacterized protein n=1 Tax=Novipirellula artificiosorum TaxID=2528016 RepID=A0A5C6D861_9BACT|nr:hypothetical protein [Novipirellula artificiosorum]TWU32958.1 hypothetical protein Poly41_53370 [Novipirellula artificiosorum]